MLRNLALVVVFAALLPSATEAQCVWGSFDSTRINYSAGTLTGTGHSTLRGIITTNGGSVGAATGTLTAAYLAGVRVFYTSLLKTTGGALSATEHTALQNWVNGGGILIMTADYINIAACNSVTRWLGVAYSSTRWTGLGTPTAIVHPVTIGVTNFYSAAGVTFNVPAAAKLLGVDSSNRPFIAVFDSTSTQKGCVLILGDHNMFTNSYITRNDNRILAGNFAKWACGKGGGCATRASRSNYGTGLAGKNGIPSLTASANPVNGTTITLNGSNSSGATATGLLTVGLNTTSIPFLGGTLLGSLDVLAYLNIPSSGLALPVAIPPASVLCGTKIHVQLLQLDNAAAQGVSFTPGLLLIPGS